METMITYIFLTPIMLTYFMFFMPISGQVNYYNEFVSTTTRENNLKCSYFNKGILEEAADLNLSKDKCWWLDSGAFFSVTGGVGQTLQGDSVENSFWQLQYAKNNPEDTNNGARPQNIFRLVNRNKWINNTQEVLFKINKYDQSKSKNRNESNGVLLMSRYLDGDNLYYAGIRVDGMAVIKKKTNGVYTTLATAPFEEIKNINSSNLLPINKWIGEKLITENQKDGSVNLKFFVNFGDSEDWKLLLEVTDTLHMSGSPPFTGPGHVGIRSDFVDAEFSNFVVEENG